VRDQNGDVFALIPADIIPRVEVFGQYEISELTESPQKLTRLLERSVEQDASLDRRKADVRWQVEQSRSEILDTNKEMSQIEDRLASLPGLEETLKQTSERLGPFRQLFEDLRQELTIDRAFVSMKALDGLPGKEILREADTVLSALNRELEGIAKQLRVVFEVADRDLGSVESRWGERKKEVEAAYEKILRELQKKTCQWLKRTRPSCSSYSSNQRRLSWSIRPEDNLDNRFITEGVAPKMREEKRRRQFVFATHNANIPVLGDAELIVGLTASGEAGQEGKARMPREHMGSIDAHPVRGLVEEVLEGGRVAFEMRRLKYGL